MDDCENYLSDILELSDGKLQTEDGCTFNIHKVDLVRKSTYFHRLFLNELGKGKTEYLIPGIRGEILEIVLSYINGDSIRINEDNVHELLIAADYLLLESLVTHIRKTYLRERLSINNCLPFFMTALKANREDILHTCFRFIQTHFEAVVTAEDSKIGLLPFETLKKLLRSKNLCVRSESAVWMAIVKWIETDFIHRQSRVPDLLLYLTFSVVDELLATQILNHDIDTSNPLCEELNQLKRMYSNQNNLDILKNYIKLSTSPEIAYSGKGFPEQLHFICHFFTLKLKTMNLYVTYDENIDLWRKISEFERHPDYVICIGHHIYMFTVTEPNNLYYCSVDKKWSFMTHFEDERYDYGVVEIGGKIYVFGGHSADNECVNTLEVYSPDEDEWSELSTMSEMHCFDEVTIGNKIYLVGHCMNLGEWEMAMQVYDTVLDEWGFREPPSVFRDCFTTVAYHEKLYVVGGQIDDVFLKSIEVFHPVREEWTRHKDLPHTFYSTEAIVLNNELIVYDDCLTDHSWMKTNPAVKWDANLECWKTYEDESPMNSLNKYTFCSPVNRECINRIAIENKDPATQFEWSPFN